MNPTVKSKKKYSWALDGYARAFIFEVVEDVNLMTIIFCTFPKVTGIEGVYILEDQDELENESFTTNQISIKGSMQMRLFA